MIVGLVGGAVFLAFASDAWVRRMIAVILLAVVAVTLWRRWRHPTAGPGSHRVAAGVYGSLGGFTTMVANAAGPVMSMYFLAARFPVQAFLGTCWRPWKTARRRSGELPVDGRQDCPLVAMSSAHV